MHLVLYLESDVEKVCSTGPLGGGGAINAGVDAK